MELIDNDETYKDDPFVPKEHSDLLFYFSFLIWVTAIYAFYKKKYDAFVLCVLITLTSLNHWNYPTFGLNRNLDVVLVCFAVIYIFVRAIILKIKSLVFWCCFILGLALYPFSWYLYCNENMWLSTLSHCVFHICGNTVMLLYCGI